MCHYYSTLLEVKSARYGFVCVAMYENHKPHKVNQWEILLLLHLLEWLFVFKLFIFQLYTT